MIFHSGSFRQESAQPRPHCHGDEYAQILNLNINQLSYLGKFNVRESNPPPGQSEVLTFDAWLWGTADFARLPRDLRSLIFILRSTTHSTRITCSFRYLSFKLELNIYLDK